MICGADGLCHRGAGGDGPGGDADPSGVDGGEPDDASSGVCGGGRLEDFSDDFADLAAWTVVGSQLDTCVVEAQSGRLTISTAEPGDCGVESIELYEFVDQSAALRIDDTNLNQGNPDLAFRAIVANRTIHLVWFDGAMSALNCPDSGGCGTSGIPGGIRDWWRLRHDPVEGAIAAELSSTGGAYPDGVQYTVASEDAACVRLFIGSTGQMTEELAYPIDIDRLNIP
jgi:hypothetical protein